MTDEQKEVDLDRPFTEDPAPAGEGEGAKETETKEEEVGSADLAAKESAEQARVPYSRFKNVSDARREAEAEAEKWRQRALEYEEERHTRTRTVQPEQAPGWWTKLYGDTDQSKEAWHVYYEGQQGFIQQAEERAYARLQQEQRSVQESERENLATIDDRMAMLQDSLGRDLTDEEQSKVLDIIDEFTPTGDDGKYAGDLIPFDKAWEILSMRERSSAAPRRKARDNAASIVNQPSSGQPSSEQQERDKNFVPQNWGSWMRRVPNDN